jgi:ABC-type multidrug transport system fused ATPase/permease subunit
VFDGTVLENLTYAMTSEDIGNVELENIITLAKCEFIYDLPDGIKTEI